MSEGFAEFVRRFPTVDAYMAYHQAAGHICCGCVHQPTPMPCCNPGHDEAQRLRAEFDRIVTEEGARPPTDAARLSRLLFNARELIDMLFDIVQAQTGREDPWAQRTRDEIDAYRAERGWDPHGFGGEP